MSTPDFLGQLILFKHKQQNIPDEGEKEDSNFLNSKSQNANNNNNNRKLLKMKVSGTKGKYSEACRVRLSTLVPAVTVSS